MDKEWIREKVEEKIEVIYGLKNPTMDEVEEMVNANFSENPTLQFPGFRRQHPLFGCYQGSFLINEHYKGFFSTLEIMELEKEFIIVDGFSADAHYRAKVKFKESGSTFDFEFIALVDLDMKGLVKDIKLYFDTANFLDAFKTPNSEFMDVREGIAHPPFDPNSDIQGGQLMSNFYNLFYEIYTNQRPWDDFWPVISDNFEVVFKSKVGVLPYAGRHVGKDGFKQWFENLFSIWSLESFNFTKIYAEGNTSDAMMHELHRYKNPDGTTRYLDVYIVQSWRYEEGNKLNMFKSFHDSAWLLETLFVTDTYKAHYGYPKDYAK